MASVLRLWLNAARISANMTVSSHSTGGCSYALRHSTLLSTPGLGINEEGETVILRGWGMGNWMNPEGFMIGGTTPQGGGYAQPKKLDRARSLDQLLRELCGTEYAESFWPRWYRAYLKEKDIRAMAELGYNAVRLVLESSAFLKEEPGICWNEDTFSMLDDVLDEPRVT